MAISRLAVLSWTVFLASLLPHGVAGALPRCVFVDSLYALGPTPCSKVFPGCSQAYYDASCTSKKHGYWSLCDGQSSYRSDVYQVKYRKYSDRLELGQMVSSRILGWLDQEFTDLTSTRVWHCFGNSGLGFAAVGTLVYPLDEVCNKKHKNAADVCHGNGNCTASDTCECEPNPSDGTYDAEEYCKFVEKPEKPPKSGKSRVVVRFFLALVLLVLF